MRLEALERIDVHAGERIGALGRNLLDLDAALGREHQERLTGAAVERDRQVVLARDLRGRLDPEPPYDVAADVEPEDLAGPRRRLLRGRPRASRRPAFPRPPVSTCALTTTGPPSSSAACRASSGVVARCARRDRNPEAREELLALVLVAGPSPANLVARRSAGRQAYPAP